MQRTVFRFIGVAVITLAAAGLTEATLAYGDRNAVSDGQPSVMASPSPRPTKTPIPTSAPTVSPPMAPASTPVLPTAVTNSFVHLRSGASTNSAIIANLDGGTIVTLDTYVDSQWQAVIVNGQSGYVYRSYLTY